LFFFSYEALPAFSKLWTSTAFKTYPISNRIFTPDIFLAIPTRYPVPTSVPKPGFLDLFFPDPYDLRN
jgi:hypothetical protein